MARPVVPVLLGPFVGSPGGSGRNFGRIRPWQRPFFRPGLGGHGRGARAVAAPPQRAVRWLDQFKRADTRTIAADWLKGNTGKGTRVAVENSGPTYLEAAGFRVASVELLIDHPPDWYRERADYLVISAADLSRYGDYLAAGPTVFQVSPTAQRWGPPVSIVRLAPQASRPELPATVK